MTTRANTSSASNPGNGPRLRKFRRQAPDTRREALMDATLHCLADHGVEKTSIRNISEQAGVSVGLINHYYDSKEALIADVYARLADGLLESLRTEVEAAAATSARERLSAFFRASFSPLLLDPELLRAWLSFWSMIHHSRLIADVHARTYGDQLATLEGMLEDLAREEGLTGFDARLAAVGLSGLLDGLWVEWCLHSGTFSRAEGVRLCEACLAGMIGEARTPVLATDAPDPPD